MEVGAVAITIFHPPTGSRAFRRWLDPIDGAGPRISVAGAAVVVLGYAALILIFAFVG